VKILLQIIDYQIIMITIDSKNINFFDRKVQELSFYMQDTVHKFDQIANATYRSYLKNGSLYE